MILDVEGIFAQQSILPASPYPVIESETLSYNLAEASPYSVSMPASVNAGDLLLVVFACDRNPPFSMSGFTGLGGGAYSTNLTAGVFGKVADGSEGGTTATLTLDSSRDNAFIVYRISGWGGTLATDVVVASFVPAATSISPNPPALTSGFGSVPTLWIAVTGFSGAATLTAVPSGYTSSGSIGTNDGTASAMICGAWRDATVDAENPGTFTLSAGVASFSSTVAVRPD